MEDTAKAFWVQRPGVGEIRDAPILPLRDGEVRVRALYSGISRGTEARVFRGEVPPSQRAVMRAPFQEGEFPGPVKYGYMSVGVVEEGAGLRGRELQGRTVFCLHPHQDRYVVPAAAAIPLPHGLPPERAVLAANMETAVNGVWDARPAVGDRILVVGGGVVGMLVAWLLARIPGVGLLLVDPNPARGPVALELGVVFAGTVPRDYDADLVIHASGSPGGLADALKAAAQEATVVELSWFGDDPVPLPLGEGFHPRRLTLRSSQVGHIPPHQRPRWDPRRRLELALTLLNDPALDALITGESPFRDLPAVMERLARDGGDVLCHRIRYP
ncbi:MAG TPA: zinc-binding alcohol dehydrogenase [Longimicrobiales bacterium]|nr:zinc-binding alcohol dehydrogenase [Longimicrobiales bacterium]